MVDPIPNSLTLSVKLGESIDLNLYPFLGLTILTFDNKTGVARIKVTSVTKGLHTSEETLRLGKASPVAHHTSLQRLILTLVSANEGKFELHVSKILDDLTDTKFLRMLRDERVSQELSSSNPTHKLPTLAEFDYLLRRLRALPSNDPLYNSISSVRRFEARFIIHPGIDLTVHAEFYEAGLARFFL